LTSSETVDLTEACGIYVGKFVGFLANFTTILVRRKEMNLLCVHGVTCGVRRRHVWEASGTWRSSWKRATSGRLCVFHCRQHRQPIIRVIFHRAITIHGRSTTYALCRCAKKRWEI